MTSGRTSSPSITSARRASMKSTTMVASGPMTRSTDEWLMSRSCQSAMSSSAASACARTSRARPQTFSASTGLRLWGIAEEPFWPGANGREPAPVAPELGPPARALEAEGDRLGVDAVRPPDHERVAVALGLHADGLPEAIDPGEQEVGGIAQLECEGRVDHVARGEPEVQEAALVADRLRHRRHERDHVVLDLV